MREVSTAIGTTVLLIVGFVVGCGGEAAPSPSPPSSVATRGAERPAPPPLPLCAWVPERVALVQSFDVTRWRAWPGWNRSRQTLQAVSRQHGKVPRGLLDLFSERAERVLTIVPVFPVPAKRVPLVGVVPDVDAVRLPPPIFLVKGPSDLEPAMRRVLQEEAASTRGDDGGEVHWGLRRLLPDAWALGPADRIAKLRPGRCWMKEGAWARRLTELNASEAPLVLYMRDWLFSFSAMRFDAVLLAFSMEGAGARLLIGAYGDEETIAHAEQTLREFLGSPMVRMGVFALGLSGLLDALRIEVRTGVLRLSLSLSEQDIQSLTEAAQRLRAMRAAGSGVGGLGLPAPSGEEGSSSQSEPTPSRAPAP